ncbi:MAG: AAA family ATPase, partial [Candidatus Babeliales bacterium]
MYIQSLYVKHFRCFEEKQILFDGKLVLIDGMNGVGKTSLLEALHYICYLSSFRTSLPREMIAFHYDNFFLKIDFCSSFESQHV